MTYNVLATGSTGNALILNDTVLVDCGVPFRTLRPYLKQLRLVLLTHEHGDHFKSATVRALAVSRPLLRFACCDWLVQKLLDAGVSAERIDVLRPNTWAAYAGPIYVCPVPLVHNVPNCGYRIDDGQSRAIYMTDTGTLDGITAKNYDLYFVEANHTRADLERRAAEKEAAGQFAYERAAAENHLSYEQTVSWLAENMGGKSFWIPMHLHKEGGDDGKPDD